MVTEALAFGKSLGADTVILQSGWGDGTYPVIGGYDANGNLERVHIDFLVVGGGA